MFFVLWKQYLSYSFQVRDHVWRINAFSNHLQMEYPCMTPLHIPQHNSIWEIFLGSLGFQRCQHLVRVIFRTLTIVCVCMLSHAWLFATPMDCSLPASSVRGILQARILEQVSIPFSRGSSLPRDQTHISCISCIGRQIFTTEPPGKPNHTC